MRLSITTVILLALSISCLAFCGCQQSPTSPVATSPSPSTLSQPPSAEVAAQTAELLTNARSRLRELQDIKTEENGYPDLFHIVEDTELLKDAKMKSLSPYAEIAPEDLDAFQSVYPDIKAALSKPYFFCRLDSVVGRKDTPDPNYSELTKLNDSLLVFGKFYEQKEPEKALEAYLLSWKIGAGISGKGKAINQSISVKLQTSALERITELLATESLSTESVERCLNTLNKQSVSKEDLVASTDLEFLWFHNIVVFMENGERFDFRLEEFQALDFPRERAAFGQLYVKTRERLQNLSSPDKVSDEALAAQGLVLTAITYQNLSRLVLDTKESLTRFEAVKVLSALQLYKAEKKSYPTNLKELVPKYLKTSPKDYLNESGKFIYKTQDGDFSLVTESELLKDVREENTPGSSPQVYKEWRSEE